MKVVTGRHFFERFGARAEEIVPGLQWVLLEPDGSWSGSLEGCALGLLAGDAYHPTWIDAVTALEGLRWVHTEDAGTDGPFYDAMRAKQVLVTHSPGANAIAVAEFAFGLVLWSAKRFADLAELQRQHQWEFLSLTELSVQTLLVVGLGNIGSRVARYGKAFGMRVIGVRQSRERLPEVDQQVTPEALHQVLPEADFVVLAVPLSATTAKLIGAPELALMRRTATLVNIARGKIVDVEALAAALREGRLRHACLDVLPQEPLPAESPLWEVPNLFITPHNAWGSPMYHPRVAEMWYENLRRYVRGEPLLHTA